jgi:ABC-2 type transport system permease protein
LLGIYATGRSNASFYIVGNAIQIAALSGIFGVTMSIGDDRSNGTLLYIFGTPTERLILFMGRATIHVLDGILGVMLSLGCGAVLLGLDLSHTNLLALGITIIITTFSTAGLGLLLGCVSLMTRNVMFLSNTVYFLLLLFSGANVALTDLPSWMQVISWLLPITRGIAAARALVDSGNFSQVAPLLGGELLIGLAYIVLGYISFCWFEFRARKFGTLEAF